MGKPRIAILVALLSCCFVAACQKGDGWKEYKYRDDGFAISAPSKPIPAPPSPEEPNTRAYGLNYGDRTMVVIAAGKLDMFEELSDKEKLQRLKDLLVRGTSSKLVSEKEISLGGNPGIDFEIEAYADHSCSRYYIVDGKFLALQSYAPSGAPFAVDTDRIFDSLRLLR